MPDRNEFDEVKQRIETLKGQLAVEITDDDWRTYLRVRDIVRAIVEVRLAPEEGGAVAAEAEEAQRSYKVHPMSHACAMLGIFEPAQGEGTSTEYDAAAVERFAALGR